MTPDSQSDDCHLRPSDGTKTVVLVGLDEQSEGLGTALRAEGYSTIFVGSAEGAVDLLRAKLSSLVVCAFEPHPRDTFEGLNRLLTAEPGAAVIVLTGTTDMSMARRALRQGAFAYVHRPVDPFQLLTQLYAARLRQTPTRLVSANTKHFLQGMAPYQVANHLALACLAKDAETGTHVARVGRYSAIVARVMGFSLEQAEFIEVAATTHDVGKLGIPKRILNKPGRLTPEEFEIVKEHTIIGGAILGGTDLPLLQLAERIALEHHERWDGAGYPYGLVGDESLVESRIAGIADVYDALVHDRVYKKAWPEARVLELFIEQRGKQFDPQVVDAFMAVLPQIQEARYELEAHSDVQAA